MDVCDDGYGIGLFDRQGAGVKGGVEMSKKAAERLREYCRKTIEDSKNHGLNWAYGGVCYAFYADLITREEFKTLLEEFELVSPGTVL